MTRCMEAACYPLNLYKKVLIFTALFFFFNFNLCFCRFGWRFSNRNCSCEMPTAACEQPVDKPEDERKDYNATQEHEWREETESHPHHWKAAHAKTVSGTAAKIITEVVHGHSTAIEIVERAKLWIWNTVWGSSVRCHLRAPHQAETVTRVTSCCK